MSTSNAVANTLPKPPVTVKYSKRYKKYLSKTTFRVYKMSIGHETIY